VREKNGGQRREKGALVRETEHWATAAASLYRKPTKKSGTQACRFAADRLKQKREEKEGKTDQERCVVERGAKLGTSLERKNRA